MASHNDEADDGYSIAPEFVLWAPGASYAITAPPGESGETDPPTTTAEYDMGHSTDADMLPGMDNSEHRHHHPMATVHNPARLAEGGWSDGDNDFCHSQDEESDRSGTSFLDALSPEEDGDHSEVSWGFRDVEGNLVLLERDLSSHEDSTLQAGQTAEANASKAVSRSTSPAIDEPQSKGRRAVSSGKPGSHRSSRKKKATRGDSSLSLNKVTNRKRPTSGWRTLKSASEAPSGSFNAASTVAMQGPQGKGKQTHSAAFKVKYETINPTPKDWRSFDPDSLPDKIRLLVNNLEMTEVGKDTKTRAIRNRQTGIAITVEGITQKKWMNDSIFEVGPYDEGYLSECSNHLYEKAFITSIIGGKVKALKRLRRVPTAILGCCEYNEGDVSAKELSLLSQEFIRRRVNPATHQSPELGLKVMKQPLKPAPQDDTSTSLDSNSYLSTQHPGI